MSKYSYDAIKDNNGNQEEWSVFEVDTEKELPFVLKKKKPFNILLTNSY